MALARNFRLEGQAVKRFDRADGGAEGELFDRAERCIANWCIANPELVDSEGRAVEERGVRSVEDVVNRLDN